MNRKERMQLAREVAEALCKKYKDVLLVGIYGSAARGEDDEFSDLELIAITKTRKLHLGQFTLGTMPVEIFSQAKKAALRAVGKADLMWPSYAGKYLEVKPLYGDKNVLGEFRRAARAVKQADFDEHASAALSVMREQLGKVKNAAKRGNMEKCVEAATWLTYTATLFVALLNRKYYKRHGINSIREAKAFRKLPRNYTSLMKRLHTSRNMSELAKTAQELHDACISLGSRNRVLERRFEDVADAVK